MVAATANTKNLGMAESCLQAQSSSMSTILKAVNKIMDDSSQWRNKLNGARVISPHNYPHWHIQLEDGTLLINTFSSSDEAEEFLKISKERAVTLDDYERLTCSPLEL